MGNEQSSSMYSSNTPTTTTTTNSYNGKQRRKSTAVFGTASVPHDIFGANAAAGCCDNGGTRQQRRLEVSLSPQQHQRQALQPNCVSRGRRRSSCAALMPQMLEMPPSCAVGSAAAAACAGGAGGGIHQQQMMAHLSWQEGVEEEEKPASAHFALNSARFFEAAPPATTTTASSRLCAKQTPPLLLLTGGSRHLLAAPSSPTTIVRSNSSNCNRNRRMSVAGDQQESLRRELARAVGGGGGIGTSSSTGGTPQRRFSRATTSNCGANSATIALVTRKMSEMAVGTAAETTVHEQLKLSSYQLHILQQSWPRIRSSGAFANAFKDLAHRNASAKEMFQKMSIVEGFSSGKCCDQKEHGRQLAELFDFALQNLNGPSRLVQDRCYRMGEQHFTVFGSSNNEALMWDDLGESISHALAKTESVRGKREAFRAWITLTNFLVESMRVGYTQQFKRRSLHRHSSSSQVVVQLATLEELSPSVPALMAARHRSHTPTVPLTTL